MKIFSLITILLQSFSLLFAQSTALSPAKKSDIVAPCSLGKIANETEDKPLKKSECVQYCLNAFANSKVEFAADGTVKKSICQWNNKDVLILGGFTNDSSPAPLPENKSIPVAKEPTRNIASTDTSPTTQNTEQNLAQGPAKPRTEGTQHKSHTYKKISKNGKVTETTASPTKIISNPNLPPKIETEVQK